MNRQFISNSNYVLRKVFINGENLDIIQDFVENILEIKISKIELDQYLNKEIKGIYSEKINGIAQMQIVTEDKEEINVGIQIIDGKYIQEKILIYGAVIHASQNKDCIKGNQTKTVTINIIDLEYFTTNDDYHKKIVFAEDGMIFHILELPKFKKSKIETKKDAWMAYIKSDNKELVEVAKKKSEKINKLDRELDNYWKNEEL